VGCPPRVPSAIWMTAAHSPRDDATCSGVAQSSNKRRDRNLAQGRVFPPSVYATVGGGTVYHRPRMPRGSARGRVRRQPAYRLFPHAASGSFRLDGNPVLEFRCSSKSRRRRGNHPGKGHRPPAADPPPTPPFQGGELKEVVRQIDDATKPKPLFLPPSLKGRGRGWVGFRITRHRPSHTPSTPSKPQGKTSPASTPQSPAI
jgi:hypothetical protein